MAENITKGFCYRYLPDMLCPECRKESLVYIGCELRPVSSIDSPITRDIAILNDLVHYYHCRVCGGEWPNIMLIESCVMSADVGLC